jgi:hypothetical membrane protein
MIETKDRLSMGETVPVPPQLRRRLWYGVVSSGLFIVAVYIEGEQRSDYDAKQQSISALSLGSRGWVQMLNFIIFGVNVLSTVTAWRNILVGRRRAMAFPILIALTGMSLIICGIIPQDPAPGYDPHSLALEDPTLRGAIHLLFAAVGALSSVAGLLVMAWYFSGDPIWYGWNVYSVLMAVAMAACVTLYAIWSTASTGYAGIFERLGLMVIPIWSLTFLVRLETGAPFMRPQRVSDH